MSDPQSDPPQLDPSEPPDAYGQPISADRQVELQGYLDRWAAEAGHGERRGPFDGGPSKERMRLTGADVSWLAEHSGRDADDRVPNLHLERADLSRAHLERANLSRAQLADANLSRAQLAEANLSEAQLERANLSRAHLERAFLSRVHLERADLSEAQLAGAFLIQAHLAGANLSRAQLAEANLSEAQLADADLSEAQLAGANLSRAQLERANLIQAHLAGASLSRAQLADADLSEAQLERADLSEAHLERADLSEAQLVDADLSEAQLERADLGFARLAGANLYKAQLERADLREAQLERANLYKAQLTGASLYKAQLAGASLIQAQLAGVDLYKAQVADADLREAFLDAATEVSDAIWTAPPHKTIGPQLADVRWGGANLTAVRWERIKVLGDEQVAKARRDAKKHRKRRQTRSDEYKAAGRAYRLLFVALRAQGLPAHATRYHYRAEVMDRKALWHARSPLRWLFSWLLGTFAGYGDRLGRLFATYGVTVGVFALLMLGAALQAGGALSLDTLRDTLVLSVTSFHGRGVQPPGLHLDDTLATLAGLEAVFGLLIEVLFIAAFTRRVTGG